jgi:hypothetical protein
MRASVASFFFHLLPLLFQHAFLCYANMLIIWLFCFHELFGDLGSDFLFTSRVHVLAGLITYFVGTYLSMLPEICGPILGFIDK